MKNKLIVMFFTFIVLIAITPFIFSKLMNAKFDEMLDNLRKDGVEIRLIEDKSSYIKTDKLFLVTIPEKFLVKQNLEGIKNIVLKVEAQFKNLPVTDVLFLGEVKKIALSSNLENIEHELNEFAKYIKFVVTTPDFKNYFYRFEDIKDKKFSILGIKGTFSKKELNKNSLAIKEFYIKDRDGFFEVKNLKHNLEWNDKKSFSRYSFDVNFTNNRINVQIDNIHGSGKTILNKDVNASAKVGFNKLTSPFVEADKFQLNLKLTGIESSILKEMTSTKNIEPYIEKIFEKGFKVAVDSNLNTLKALNKDLGGYKFNLNITALPTHNVEEKIKNNNFDFIEVALFLEASPEIATFIMNTLPDIAFLFELAKKEKDRVILNLEFKNGKLYSEGKLIK